MIRLTAEQNHGNIRTCEVSPKNTKEQEGTEKRRKSTCVLFNMTLCKMFSLH